MVCWLSDEPELEIARGSPKGSFLNRIYMKNTYNWVAGNHSTCYFKKGFNLDAMISVVQKVVFLLSSLSMGKCLFRYSRRLSQTELSNQPFWQPECFLFWQTFCLPKTKFSGYPTFRSMSCRQSTTTIVAVFRSRCFTKDLLWPNLRTLFDIISMSEL